MCTEHCNFFLWCDTWVDVIYIWDVVLVLIVSNVYIIKSRRDRCSFELLADDAWESEYDKTGFFSVVVDIFDHLFLKNDQFPCSWCKIWLKTENMINEDKQENSKNRKMRKQLMNDRFFVLVIPPPMKGPKNLKLLNNQFW